MSAPVPFTCSWVSGLLWAAFRRFLAGPAGLADPGPSFRELMEELRPRRAADKQLKQQFLDALRANNAQEVTRILHTGKLDIDTVMEVDDPSMVLASYKQGYWLPGYKLEKSWAMAVHVCAMYGAVETALLLLEAGAAVNSMPNGKTPLHVACETSDADCVAVLLAHGAKVDSLSLSGHTPLHYCVTARSVDCAEQLIAKGLNVNVPGQNTSEDTPLHTAARFGIPELAGLYLAHGASVDALNSLQETPLMTAAFWAFDSREQTYSREHHLVCRLLLDHRADPNLQDEDHKTALHKASWNCDHVLMQMLLEAGADARAMDVNGCAPIQYLLKVTGVRPAATPELCFQLLLNHNAARIYPPQFHKVSPAHSKARRWEPPGGPHLCSVKVLQSCHDYPGVLEVLVNSYERLTPTRKWKAAVPDDCYKRHEAFYESMFAVCAHTPRSLLHLTRCAIRAHLGAACHSGVARLPLPPLMRRYLLLDPEGTLY